MLTKRTFLKLKILLVVLIAASAACGQRSLTEVTDKDEVKVEFEFLGKAGKTKPYLIDLKSIPNGSRLPTGYALLANKTYNIKNNAIEYGETIVSFKVPVASQEQFQKVRVLKLRPNELNPSGFEWHDCTIAGPDSPYQHEEESFESRKERIAKFFPDFSKKQISCGLPFDTLEPDNYFALSLQTSQPPAEPVTQIVTKLESSIKLPDSVETTYTLSFRNIGKKSVSEVNFYSRFDDDSILVAANPGQGRCQKARLRSSSVVCHLGALAQGATVNVEFIGRASNSGGLTPRPRPNFNWLIEGFVKEHPDDSTLLVNRFTFEPIAN